VPRDAMNWGQYDKLKASGKSRREIARIMSIGESTLRDREKRRPVDADAPNVKIPVQPEQPTEASISVPAIAESREIADTETLTAAEEHRYRLIHQRILEGTKRALDLASDLLIMRDEKLYRGRYPNFQAYCEANVAYHRSYAYHLMDFLEVRNYLSTKGDKGAPLPENVGQTRIIAKLAREDWGPVWQKAVETSPKGQVTATHIAKTANPNFGKRKPGKQPFSLPAVSPMLPRREQAQQLYWQFLELVSDQEALDLLTEGWETLNEIIGRKLDGMANREKAEAYHKHADRLEGLLRSK
jgi:hypothetical protein